MKTRVNPGLYGHDVAGLRGGDVLEADRAQPGGQGVSSIGLAVHEADALRRAGVRSEASQQVAVVGMAGQAVEHDDLGLDREQAAEDAYLRPTVHQSPP